MFVPYSVSLLATILIIQLNWSLSLELNWLEERKKRMRTIVDCSFCKHFPSCFLSLAVFFSVLSTRIFLSFFFHYQAYDYFRKDVKKKNLWDIVRIRSIIYSLLNRKISVLFAIFLSIQMKRKKIYIDSMSLFDENVIHWSFVTLHSMDNIQQHKNHWNTNPKIERLPIKNN